MRFRLTGLLSTFLLDALTLSRLAFGALGITRVSLYADTTEGFCTQEQKDRFDPATMQTDLNAMVRPIGELEKFLAAVVITMPPDSCVYEHTHWGAMVLYVQSGQIDFMATRAPEEDEPEESGLELMVGTSFTEGSPTVMNVLNPDDPVETVTLGPNQWVTQNGMVRHAFRNRSLEHPAVLIAATYAEIPPDDWEPGPGRCNGRCSSRGG